MKRAPPGGMKEVFFPMHTDTVKRSLLALALMINGLFVSGVQADQPVAPQTSPFPLNQPVSFSYTDTQGNGTITLVDVGANPVTGGRELQVSILKSGFRYNGSGFVYNLFTPPPTLNYLIAFTVIAPGGTPLMYEGKLGTQGTFLGQGTYFPLGNPFQMGSWSLAPLPQVTLSRTYLSFGSTRLGGTVGPLCFTITNPGSQPVVINNVSITNCSSSIDPTYIDCARVAGFQIVSGGNPVVLGPGEARDVCMVFTPGEAATFSAFVLINTSASTTPAQVELHGTGER